MNLNQQHIIVTLSSHGYGHAVMTAPLINHLQQRHPELKITLRSTLPLAFLKGKFHGPFDYLPQNCDVGMLMNSAFEVDQINTLKAYQEFHGNWSERISEEMKRLSDLDASMVISNIAYLPLIAAQQLSIPAIAISCLNWADIFAHYFPGEFQLHQQIVNAYQSANTFIRAEPAMPMSNLTTHTVAPLAALGTHRRPELLKTLNLSSATKLVLVSMGGIKTELNAPHWPVLNNVHYIAANPIETSVRSDITPIDTVNINYSDLLSSCDLLLTKPGYGSFTEAALNNTPVLYVCRDEWPEQPYLTTWLRQQLPCEEITLDQFKRGDFSQPMQQLLNMGRPKNRPESGIEAAVELISFHIK